jgi:hypothetical protein
LYKTPNKNNAKIVPFKGILVTNADFACGNSATSTPNIMHIKQIEINALRRISDIEPKILKDIGISLNDKILTIKGAISGLLR